MENLNGALGSDDYGMGNVDMFGLDEFGMPAGADALWGAVIGGGLGTGTAIIVRRVTQEGSTLNNYSEALGLLAAGLAGGVMMAFPGSRRMGWTAMAVGLVTNGMRQIETMFFKKKDLAQAVENGTAAEAAAEEGAIPAGFGSVVIDPTAVIQPFHGLGQDIDVAALDGVVIDPGYLVPGSETRGLGIHAIEPGYAVNGLGAGPYESMQERYDVSNTQLVGPPSLHGAGDYGMSQNPGVAQVAALGGPGVSGLAGHFGATLFG